MKARSTISRWLGWLATVGAAAVIVLAVLVGIARLLLPMAPEYQDDIRRFANEATGFDVQFGRLSASWPLHGRRSDSSMYRSARGMVCGRYWKPPSSAWA